MEAVVDVSSTADEFGFPAGAELLRFATAANRAANPVMAGDADEVDLLAELAAAREMLLKLVGQQGVVEAAATVAAFNGLVRVADGTGIELDAGLNEASVELRSELKLDDLSGAANTRSLRTKPDHELEPVERDDGDSPRPVGSFFMDGST